jgi:hypothetical protein
MHTAQDEREVRKHGKKRQTDRQKYEKKKITAFWNATQCRVAYRQQSFGRICSLHIQDYSPLPRGAQTLSNTVTKKERKKERKKKK